MKLSDLKTGDEAVILKILGHGAFRKRCIEMGFVKGRKVKAELCAPLNDPVKYSIMGYEVSLRHSEANLIEVEPIASVKTGKDSYNESKERDITGTGETINIALIGNPNCGKTSLFNIASGAHEHVGNYSGVTVDAKMGHFKYRGYKFNIVDLPGTYSLASYSPEEVYVRRYLQNETPDVIVNVVDASNLERNLYLTTELIDMDRSMVIALNMYDELLASGATIDYKMLGGMIGVPMVPVVARTGEGVNRLFDNIISVYEGKNEEVRHVHVVPGKDIEKRLRILIDEIKEHGGDIPRHFSPRYIAIKLLEGDKMAEEMVMVSDNGKVILDCRDQLLKEYEMRHAGEDISSNIAAEKYGFIHGALAETFQSGDKTQLGTTRVIDAFVTNRLFGFPIFAAIMFFIFWATFSIGQFPMDWIEEGVDFISKLVGQYMPEGILKDMVADGIIGGVGGVIVFLPNILILYFCISFMEDSGYMARAAFIMDKLMHRIGLHGKSFIPMVMGFGCNVPAIMATRAIESNSSRLITILINPFMSCSARLPIYVLLIGTFFPSHAALVFMGLYIAGILVAIATAKILRKFYFKDDETPFVMELPPYRVPTLKASLRHTWAKGEQYLKKMGGIILFASIIVWALNYFPLRDGEREAIDTESLSTGDSYLEMAGKAVNPMMEPLGFHWRASVAALAGVPAKEIVVSTLGVLYTNDEAIDDQRLGQRLTTAVAPAQKPDFDYANALSFMVFILLYCPCIATVTAIVRETQSWRYGLFSIIYNTAVAWLMAFVVYRIALLF